MKREACVLILAFAVSGVGVMGQEKAKGKGKPAPTVAQPAPPPAQAKEKPKDRPAGAPGSTGQAGGGSCTPDTTAPVIAAVSATPNSIWSPNHKMTPVSITAKVTDNCSVPTWSVTGITSSEPVNGTGDGDTAPDWSIAGPHAVTLRAERAGAGTGRAYTITITAKDAAGNVSTGTTTVSVPHNQ